MLSAAEFLNSNFKKNEDLYKKEYSFGKLSNVFQSNFSDDSLLFNFSSERALLKDSSLTNLFVRAFNKKKSTNSVSNEFLENSMFGSLDKNVFSSDLLTNFSRQGQSSNNTYVYNFLENLVTNENLTSKPTYHKYSDYNNMLRWVKKPSGVLSSARIIKLDLTDSTDAFDVRFSNPDVTTQQKVPPHSTFLTMKQKRYARKKSILPRSISYRDDEGRKLKKVKFSGKLALKDNQTIEQVYSDANKQYRFFRKNKLRYENTSVLLSKRMLRTRRTLVLPAHVNLTAITNSYDVIHS